jgi:hypothetical protein
MSLAPPVEIREKVALCDVTNRLNPQARGWARQPLFRALLSGPFLRRKRWNFVFVSHPDVLVAAALSNADYAGLAFVWIYDLKRKRFLEVEHLSPLARGVTVGDTLEEESAFRTSVLTNIWQPSGRGVEIDVAAPRMKGDRHPLSLRLRIPDLYTDESLNLIVPWSETRWNYTGKLVALAAEGELSVGGERYALTRDKTLASIDFTRGIWPYRTVWKWASGAGIVETGSGAGERRIGVNFGSGWTDGTGVLENALFVDGKVMPLWEPVEFSCDPRALEAPWTMRTTESRRVELRFTPNYSRTQDTNLVVLRIKLAQVMGHFSGTIVTDQGETLRIDALPGIAENHLARW